MTNFKLVPVEPTDEMIEAAWDSDAVDYVGEHKRIYRADKAYAAMLAAAPRCTDKTEPAPEPDSALVYLRYAQILVKALKRLSFAAQTSGGTSGTDIELMDAIAEAGKALSISAAADAIDTTALIEAARAVVAWHETKSNEPYAPLWKAPRAALPKAEP